ncbi:MAG TPA: TetR/AcrR family transcriptional regulator [Acidimicrobiia bacterium]|nr:TetR/AcrR family transcriptional regulator [Acidimicrobiia bacterium]
MAEPEGTQRDRIIEGAYECVARFGMAKTTIEDVAKASGVSRATIYRQFPGGRDELLRETVAWEAGRFMGRLAEEVAGAPDLPALVESALRFAHRALLEHEVLQKVLATEPERFLPMLTVDRRPLAIAEAFLLPYVERAAERGLLRDGVDPREATEYVARMLLSLAASPGSVDHANRDEVRELVRDQVLAGIVAVE